MTARSDALQSLVRRWRDDEGGTYRTWFLWEERLKNFRSIRGGVAQVVSEIRAGTFGCVYKGSSLETVVGSIAEQRQIFKGADHAFLWKPKLRIPDIYEDADNQRAFAEFLDCCACCSTEGEVLDAIERLNARRIKGLGPAAANLLYFLHPTFAPPFNTAIVKGYNALTGSKIKLGRWDEYLCMRRGMLALNADLRDLLSNDLGAVAGLLFDLGTGRYSPPPLDPNDEAIEAWREDLQRVREEAKAQKAQAVASANDRTHTEIQGWLRDLGRNLGFQVWIASNDRRRPYDGGLLGDHCVGGLPPSLAETPASDTIRLIDVLWIDAEGANVAAAFEVEHTTSIYSGIVRLLDLALSASDGPVRGLFLVAPDEREEDVRAQLARPAFRHVADLNVRYVPYGQLELHRESMV